MLCYASDGQGLVSSRPNARKTLFYSRSRALGPLSKKSCFLFQKNNKHVHGMCFKNVKVRRCLWIGDWLYLHCTVLYYPQALVSNLYFFSQLLYKRYSTNFLVRMLGAWQDIPGTSQSVPVSGLAYYVSPPRSWVNHPPPLVVLIWQFIIAATPRLIISIVIHLCLFLSHIGSYLLYRRWPFRGLAVYQRTYTNVTPTGFAAVPLTGAAALFGGHNCLK